MQGRKAVTARLLPPSLLRPDDFIEETEHNDEVSTLRDKFSEEELFVCITLNDVSEIARASIPA